MEMVFQEGTLKCLRKCGIKDGDFIASVCEQLWQISYRAITAFLAERWKRQQWRVCKQCSGKCLWTV